MCFYWKYHQSWHSIRHQCWAVTTINDLWKNCRGTAVFPTSLLGTSQAAHFHREGRGLIFAEVCQNAIVPSTWPRGDEHCNKWHCMKYHQKHLFSHSPAKLIRCRHLMALMISYQNSWNLHSSWDTKTPNQERGPCIFRPWWRSYFHCSSPSVSFLQRMWRLAFQRRRGNDWQVEGLEVVGLVGLKLKIAGKIFETSSRFFLGDMFRYDWSFFTKDIY